MPDTVIISNLPSHSPSGSDYLAIEDSSQTGKATVDDVVGASSSVAALNSELIAVGTYDGTSTFSSATTLATVLDGLLNSMGSFKIGCYRISCTASFDLFTSGYDYCVQLTRASSLSYCIAELTPIDDGLTRIIGKRRTNGWSFDSLALNSKLTVTQVGSDITYTPSATNTWGSAGSFVAPQSGLYYLTSTYSGYRTIGIGFSTSETVTGAPSNGYVTSDIHIYKTPMFYLSGGERNYIQVKGNTTGGSNTIRCYRYG